MTDEQIEAYRERLNQLTAECSEKKPEEKIHKKLTELARDVGASTRVLWIHPTRSITKSSVANTSELIRNIHQALQTATMINMCKTATQGYEIATKAIRNAFIYSCIATIIALICAAAAWVAAIRN